MEPQQPLKREVECAWASFLKCTCLPLLSQAQLNTLFAEQRQVSSLFLPDSYYRCAKEMGYNLSVFQIRLRSSAWCPASSCRTATTRALRK